jgi:hypothetical protein
MERNSSFLGYFWIFNWVASGFFASYYSSHFGFEDDLNGIRAQLTKQGLSSLVSNSLL